MHNDAPLYVKASQGDGWLRNDNQSFWPINYTENIAGFHGSCHKTSGGWKLVAGLRGE